MLYLMKNIKRSVKLYVGKLKWHLLKINEPVSRKFGYDRGTPIDRVYIEDFLRKNSKYIRGVVCEIGDSTYTVKFGSDVERFEVLDYINDNQRATLIADLTDINKLPRDRFDCFIVTQTLNVIYDFKKAIYGIYYTLKDNGVALVTVPGICQISRGDYNKWGDYWRFTDLSISRAFEEVFGKNNIRSSNLRKRHFCYCFLIRYFCRGAYKG